MQRIPLGFQLRTCEAVLDCFDDASDAALQPFELALGSGQARAMLHPEPVHLACELVAELLEQILAQQLLLQRPENARFDFVPANRQLVRARPLVASAEATQAIRGTHDEPGATDSALRQAREQVARPIRRCEFATCRDRVTRGLLPVLRSRPQFVRDDPQVRNFGRDPIRRRIQPRHTLARVGILHVAKTIPHHPADVQLVVQDASAALRVSVEGARTPLATERASDALVIQCLGDLLWRSSAHELPEDAVDNCGFGWLDLALACGHRRPGHRAHDAVAITEPAAGPAGLHASTQPSVRLLGQVLQEQRVHRALEADVQVRDVAFGKGDDADAGEGETLEEARCVFLVPAEAVQRFGNDDVEAAIQRVPHQRLESGPQERRA